MGIFKWLKQTSLRSDDVAEELSPAEIVANIEAGRAFATDIEISNYASVFQECYEVLMKRYGDGAPVLGAWSAATMACANCDRPFPSSFKLHLTMPQLLDGYQPRLDCPDCGSAYLRLSYSP